MSEMIERVARAMCACERKDPDAMRGRAREWTFYLVTAERAIEALREPTEAMGLAGWVHVPPSVSPGKDGKAVATEIWSAMIDAALRDMP